MKNKHKTDQELIDGCRTGCSASFKEITERYSKKLYWFILKKVNDEDGAHDILQEVYLKVYQYLASGGTVVTNREGSINTWLYTVTKNVCMDYFRTHSRKPVMVALDVDSDREKVINFTDYQDTGNEIDILEIMREALSCLSDTERQVIIMHYFQRKSFKEIAASSNISLSGALARAHRARHSLSFYMNLLMPGCTAPKRLAVG